MKRTWVGVCACILFNGGCLSPSIPEPPIERTNAHITGIVKRGTNEHLFVDLDDTKINNSKELVEPLPQNEIVQTPDFVFIEFEDPGNTFALAGPIPSSNPHALFELGSLQLKQGWIVSWGGSWPPAVISDGWVEATASGTTFAFRYDSVGKTNRIYLLRRSKRSVGSIPGTEVNIYCNDGRGNRVWVTRLDRACDVVEIGACDPAHPPVVNNPEQMDPNTDPFYDEIMGILLASPWDEDPLGEDGDCGCVRP